MNLFPKLLGMRPRLAVEIRAEGVIAARADEGSATLAAVSRAEFAPGTRMPHTAPLAEPEAAIVTLIPGDRAPIIAALRKALDAVATRGRNTTLILPDTAVRVLLLDFDNLPTKPADALPIVRFRLKKLVPFDVEHAAVSYQILSSARGLVRVLAAAIPTDLLTAFESLVREAGYEPGVVLPSTLAALAALPPEDSAALLINTGAHSITTAIVAGGNLLLHRSLDLGRAIELSGPETIGELVQAVSVAAAYFEDTLQTQPPSLLASGTLSATDLQSTLESSGMGPILVHEVVQPTMLGPGVSTYDAAGRLDAGWLTGVRGALAS
jgi:type IV pilus assembly protein PilM